MCNFSFALVCAAIVCCLFSVRLLSQVVKHESNPIHYCDLTRVESVEAALFAGKGRIKLLMIESPTNPLMQVCDLRLLCDAAHRHGALVCCDNTLLTSWFQPVLPLGVDIAMYSATKFHGGHADLMAGYTVTQDAALQARLAFLQNATGSALAPFDSWLLLRGIKTLALRMERQQQSAIGIARWLEARQEVDCVHYVGLQSHPQFALHASQSQGSGSVLSFSLRSVEQSVACVQALRVFKRSVSFGSTTSTVQIPSYFSHKSVPPGTRRDTLQFDARLIRLSIGIEDVQDLKADLAQALSHAATLHPASG